MQATTVETYLKDYGWHFKVLKEGHWLTGFQGRDRAFPLTLTLSDTWLAFEIKPLTHRLIPTALAAEMALYLMELTEHLHMVRIYLDDRGELSLSLDLFVSNMSFESFSDSLGVLAYYSDFIYERVVVKLDQLNAGRKWTRQIYLT